MNLSVKDITRNRFSSEVMRIASPRGRFCTGPIEKADLSAVQRKAKFIVSLHTS